MSKNVIVTGATGFIGSYLVKELLKHEYRVYAVVRNLDKVSQFTDESGFHVIELDLELLTADDLPKIPFDTFFHLGWAGVNREEINDNTVHMQSMQNSLKCLEIARKAGCRCFVSVGSKAEYGVQEYEQNEEAECKPESAYGKAKLQFYREAYSYCKKVNMQFYHARLFSVIGVGDHPWSLISTACRNLAKDGEMKLGPCTQKWNFTAVEDIAVALRMLSEHTGPVEENDNGIYNIAGKDTRVLKEFVKEIYGICNSRSILSYAKEPSNGDFMNPVTDKIRELTGWKEEICFGDSIRRILEENGS